MAVDSDQTLIRAYLGSMDEDAFATLVQRHLDMVYSTAFRVLQDAGLAEDVAQRSFLALARHGNRVLNRASIAGWLYETTRNLAISTVRAEERRRRREIKAMAMNHEPTATTDAPSSEVETHLDDVLTALSETERDLVICRYFERLTADEIGQRFSISAEAAQKRISRALERARALLRKRGVVTSSGGLATALTACTLHSAPPSLAAATLGHIALISPATPLISGLRLFMTSTKVNLSLATVVVAAVVVPSAIEHRRTSNLQGELSSLRQQFSELAGLHDQLDQLAIDMRAAASQRDEARAELAGLKSQMAALKATPAVSRSATPGTLAAPEPRRETLASDPSPAFVPAQQWTNAGRGTPPSTLQTLEWAKANQDLDVIAHSLAWADDRSKAEIAAIYAAAPESVKSTYATADAYVLSLFERSEPVDDRHRVEGYRILNERVEGDEAVLEIEFRYGDGTTYVGPTRYVRIDDEWRQALDFGAAEQGKLRSNLQQQAATEPSTP